MEFGFWTSPCPEWLADTKLMEKEAIECYANYVYQARTPHEYDLVVGLANIGVACQRLVGDEDYHVAADRKSVV